MVPVKFISSEMLPNFVSSEMLGSTGATHGSVSTGDGIALPPGSE